MKPESTPSSNPPPDFKSLFESAPGLYLAVDPDLRIVALSDAYARAMMTRREVILGKSIFEVFPGNQGDPADAGIHTLKASLQRVLLGSTGDAIAVQKYDVRRSEEIGGGFDERYWKIFNSPVFAADGSVAWIIHRVEDMTEMGGHRTVAIDPVQLNEALVLGAVRQHELTEAAENLNETLRKEIAERKELSRKLAEADRNKDAFLAMLAHELRNPLAPLKTAADVLRMRKIDDPVIAKVQVILERQIDFMSRMVDDLLDTSRIQQRKVTIRRQFVNLASSVLEVLDATHDSIQQYHHSVTADLKCDPPLLIEADPARLTQIISNLIVNAVKYTPKGGAIHVSAVRGEGNMAVLRVRDNGIGIERHMLKSIFELFIQADNSLERGQGGLGLGLKLVKELVEIQGGTVEARSEGKGKGSEFIVCFPEAYDACAASPAQSEVVPGPSRRILLIDDNIDILESMKLMLVMSGHSVELAETGTQGLEKALAGTFDLALVDIGLPEMNGYEVAKRIREHRGSDGMVLIAMTGFGQMKDKGRALEAGFDDHLTKPVGARVLLNILNELEKYDT